MTARRAFIPLCRRDWIVAAVLVLAVVAGTTVRMVPGIIGVADDDAVYAITAQSLAEGDGYHLPNVPGNPPQTKYPVLYPALISVAWHGGDSLEDRLFAMQCVTTAVAAIALAMAYLYCVRFGVGSRMAAAAGCLLLACAPNFLFFSSQTLSEMPFLALLIAALWAGEERLRACSDMSPDPGGELPPAPAHANLRDVLLGTLLGLPVLCRTAGVVVPVVVVALLIRHRRAVRRPVRWIVAGVLATTLPWFAWVLQGSMTAQDAVVGYQTDYWGWWMRHGSLAVPANNLLYAGLAFAHVQFEALSHALNSRTDLARWILFPIGCLPWLLLVLRRRSLPVLLPATLICYLALLCAWPWPPDRFLVPVLPFLATLLFEGVRRAATTLGGARLGAVALVVLFAGGAASNVERLSLYAGAGRQYGYPYFAIPETPVRWQEYRQAFDWLREHSREDDVLGAGFDAMTSLYTGRAVVRPFVLRPLSLFYGSSEPPLGSVAEMRDILAQYRVRYMFLSPMPAFSMEAAFFEIVYAAMDEGVLRPVWQASGDDRFAIFEVSAPPDGP